jgi:hypothetical protein
MKKIAFLLALIVAAFASCKKDSGGQTTLSLADSSAVSAALTVWHATNTKGNTPALNPGGGLTLGGDTDQLISYKGSFVVIHPNVQGGNIQGYYIHINGSDNYFTLDFSNGIARPAAAQRPLPGQAHSRKRGLFGNRPTDTSPDYNDSLIVIQLPANIAPGTICMTIWAYDGSGYTSNVIDQCVTIEQLGSSDATSFNGNWKVAGFKFNDTTIDAGGSGSLVISQMEDTAWQHNASDSTDLEYYTVGYYCLDGYLSSDSTQYYDPVSTNYIIPTNPPEAATIPNYTWYKTSNLALANNGAWTFNGEIVFKDFSDNIDWYTALVPCSTIPSYYTREDQTDSEIGGWSYNAATNEFIVVEKNTGDSGEDTFVDKFIVVNKTANSFTLIGEDLSGSVSLEMVRQ